LSALATYPQLDKKVLYFDAGKPEGDQVKQWHLPAIDAICGGIIDNSSLIIDAFQIKSTIHLHKNSIINTVVKFVVKRSNIGNESVLSKFLKSCYSSINSLSVNLELSVNQDLYKLNVEDKSAEELSYNLKSDYNLEKITFQIILKDGTTVSGSVHLYMLIFGNIDLNLVQQYPGIRFVWGPSNLLSFIGPDLFPRLLSNPRFKLISIFEGDDELANLDRMFQKTIVIENEKESTYYCLPETNIEIRKHYLAIKHSVSSRALINIVTEEKDRQIFKIPLSRENKRKNPDEPKPNPISSSKRSRPNVWERCTATILADLQKFV